MAKLKSIDEFFGLQGRLLASRNPNIPHIVIPNGTCGQASGSKELVRVAKRELLSRQLTDKIHLRITGCHGYCEMEPSVLIEPYNTFYPKVSAEDMIRIVVAVEKGEVIRELLYKDPESGIVYEKQRDIPFFNGQHRFLLSMSEKVDPIRIYNYILNNGYSAFAHVLENNDPHAVIETVKQSGLRGRGGAGFPTGVKWEALAKQPKQRGKYLVCNADEGDPGAYMDRSLLEGNPHSIIEGMLIGAFATGATEGILYVRNEYPMAIKHLIIALRQAREEGLLGQNILGTPFSFDLSLVRGAGAFVCGEETALIRSIEGRMGEPVQRPPYPIQKGIFGRPTAINNVETWANISHIVQQGADVFSKIGTKNNSGTKIFSLVGKVRNTGLAEVTMGTRLSDIVYRIGGGSSSRARIKAVQTGGPSGGCIPENKFDLPIDYDSLAQAGSIMGSGGMIVMDQNTCMVDVARYYMGFLKDESCGKCFTCRKGTQRMYEILDDITKGKATLDHLALLEELASVMKDTTLCGLGQTAANPVLSTLRYFRHEYIRHIWDKKCDAFVCKELTGAPCQAACPIGTEAWRYVALAAQGDYEGAYRVIRETNPFPSICARVCDHACESRCKLGLSGNTPVAIRALKRFITDRVDPAVFKPRKEKLPAGVSGKVAVVGSGPAGLTAAHYLSLKGYTVTLFDADKEAGGMMLAGIPEYRLPHDILRKEIKAVLENDVSVQCGKILGKDITIDGLFKDGYKAVFLGLGAHRSRKMGVIGEDAKGSYPSMEFLRAFNLEGKKLAKERVGVIGGGNSAIDAARTALRQPGVESVTLYYRRSRSEMPAFPAEVQAAIDEGIKLETLVNPKRILIDNGSIGAMEFLRNTLGEMEASGRRGFIPVPGSEFTVPVDTLIVAIGEQLSPFTAGQNDGISVNKQEMIEVEGETLLTSRPGVFAGGDAVTGPNSVVAAIAAGRRAAIMMDRFVRGEVLKKQADKTLPRHYIAPQTLSEEELETLRRAEPPAITAQKRRTTFEEVELVLAPEDAKREARRCLRCDLEFTQCKEEALSKGAAS